MHATDQMQCPEVLKWTFDKCENGGKRMIKKSRGREVGAQLEVYC